MAVHVFGNSAALHEYYDNHNQLVWHGDVGFGILSYIDSRDIHVIFDSRKDYEDWCNRGSPVQLSLF